MVRGTGNVKGSSVKFKEQATNKSKKVLLVYPPSAISVFSKSKIQVAIPNIPYLSLAVLASPLLEKGHEVEILDLSFSIDPWKDLKNNLSIFSPDYVGISATTALYKEMVEISKIVKGHDNNIITIGGGVHVSTFPQDTVKEPSLDIVVIGEGDYTLTDIVSGLDINSINGIGYKNEGKIYINRHRDLIKNLDDLPFPAWHLYDIKKYKTPRLNCKKNPVGAMVTSRGCPYACSFCNKNVFGRKFRAKSADRVVDEMEFMLNSGFKEIHIWDDNFSADINRAKEICDKILERGLNFPWNLYNGFRVDRVDKELLEKAYDAGCYRVSFGVESGDQKILNNINKGITLDQVRQVFKFAKDVGIETMAFFMVGLPGDTEDTMRKTIEFAKEIDPDIPKVAITMPLPGTPLYNDWNDKGYIKTYDWSKYVFHAPTEVYDLPDLKWDTIFEYYNRFYRELYLNPHFILKRFIRDIRNGELLYDMYYFIKTLRWGW